MVREEGHYTIKRVDKLPKRGNLNWLYILKTNTIDKFYRALGNGSYEELNIGSSSLQDITDFTFNPTNNVLTISIEDGNTMVADLTTLKDEFAPSIVVDNYSDLLLVTGQSLFEFAEVVNAQGNSFWPGSMGGTYYAAGLYYWNGTNWIHDNDAILQGLYELTNATFLQNRIIVNQSNAVTVLGGVIDSTKEYFLDGVIDIGTTSIEVPSGGINIKGYDFNISGLISSEDNYTMFTSPIGGSGSVILKGIKLTTNGTNSQIYDLVANTGFEAIEITELNYDNCTSLGDINGYRQGLELNTGRFGGTPELTLSGTWIGGYIISLSIARGLTDGAYSLFKTGTGFVMNNRFKSDANFDLNATISYLDFAEVNIPNEDSLELIDGRVSRNGVLDASDTTIIPNITQSSLSSLWINNVGLPTTYVGAINTVTTEVETVITTIDTFVDLLGTFTASNMEHMDSPANGQIRNLGNSPREFRVEVGAEIDCNPNRELDLKIVCWDDSASVFIDKKTIRRVVNNSQGGRDVAFFNFSANVVLDKNDYVKLQVANHTDTDNITAELGSEFIIEER